MPSQTAGERRPRGSSRKLAAVLAFTAGACFLSLALGWVPRSWSLVLWVAGITLIVAAVVNAAPRR